MEPVQKPAGQPLCQTKIAMSLALTDRTFLDLWGWWDCLSKSELIKLSCFSAQPSMNLHSSRYPNQNSLQNTNNKLFFKNLKNFLIAMIAMLFKAQLLTLRKRDAFKKLLKYFLLKNYLYWKNKWFFKINLIFFQTTRKV